MTSAERWLTTIWPLVRARLPPPPVRVVDIGCGPHGGFVPFLRTSGYEAIGVDPRAPETSHYRRIEFEDLELDERLDVAIASTSLHHVTDPAEVIDRLASALTKGGTFIVVEWAREKFDEATARWCFQRLGPDDPNWLHRRRDEWTTSGRDWQHSLEEWATREGFHRGDEIVRLLDERFDALLLATGPYYFPDLANTTEADEQAAIDAGEIQANRVDWVGTLR